MEKEIKIDQEVIKKCKPDDFALKWVLKNFKARYEYLVEDMWFSNIQNQRPEKTRFIFDDISTFRAAKDTYLSWTDLNDKRVDKPVFPDVIMERIAKSRISREPLVLFSPWGVRPEGEFGQPEMAILDRLNNIRQLLAARGINPITVIMPADLYATEVNNQVSPKKANTYFETVTAEASRLGFLVKPWSQIRLENWEYYSKRSQELTPLQILQLLGEYIIEEAIEASRRRSGYKEEKDIKNAAFAYLRERICEAEIVEETLRPIKLSLVTKDKDRGVDRKLPRLYVIPREERFPWLKI